MDIDPRYSLVPAPQLGDVVLGGFRLGRQIGAGAFAAAYLAEQLGTDRLAVIKIPHPHLLQGPNGPELRRRFDAEVKAATRAKHPNLVTVYIVGDTQYGVPAIAMEYVGGESLHDHLSRVAPLRPSELVAVGGQLADALAALHAVGVVHRDLSPANVLISVTGSAAGSSAGRSPGSGHGSELAVKLLDFGVAKLLDAPSRTLGPMGTPGYLAPEQLVGDVTPACDIYSLGGVLWWASTGRERPDDFSDGSLRANLGGRVGPDPRAFNSAIPQAVAELISRALIPEPRLRPSATEFASAWRAAWNATAAPRVDGHSGPQRLRSGPTWSPTSTHSGDSSRLPTPSGARERVTTTRSQISTRVAVIVADPAARERVCRRLRDRGGVVVSQPTPRELGRASPGAFDLAILDEALDQLGTEIETAQLVEHLRNCYPELRVVVVGFGPHVSRPRSLAPDRQHDWREAGADAFVDLAPALDEFGMTEGPDELALWFDLWLGGSDLRLDASAPTLAPASGRSRTVHPEPRLRPSVIEPMRAHTPELLATNLEALIGYVPEWLAQIDRELSTQGHGPGSGTHLRSSSSEPLDRLVQAAESVAASDLARLARAVGESLTTGDLQSARVFLAATEREYFDVFQEAFRLLAQLTPEDSP